MSLSRLAVRRPVTTSMLFIALTLLGLFSANRLAIDLIPEISFPSLTVTTSYSGAAPEEMERLVTIPIEQALATLSGVTSMQSFSSEGSSRITLNFRSTANLDAKANEVRALVDQVRSRLPAEASAPRVVQFDPNQSPVMTIGLSGDMDQSELRRIAENEFVFRLERLDGVASVTLQGGSRSEVRVILDPVRLQGHRLTLDQVVNAIRSENLNVPAGRLRVGQAQFALRTIGELEGLEALGNILVANRDGVQTRLRDIATIETIGGDDGPIVRVDGRPGAILSVQKQSGSNTVAVADAIIDALDDLQRRYPDISARPINDTSVFIRNAVNNVITSGLYGGLLAGLILLVFLRSLRSTLIIGVAIPLAIVISFILIERAGMTLNTMSLGGLALGVGMLVDNSIVVLENVFRHRRMGKSPEDAAIDGTDEMALAITASTLTTLAAFLPMLFITGTSGILFRQLALMVAFSVGCSLLVALTLLPVMCAKLLRASDEGGLGPLARMGAWVERFIQRQEDEYGQSILRPLVRRPITVTLVSGILFAGSLLLVPYLGSELLPQTDEGDIGISISLPTGTAIEKTDEMVLHIEDLVRERVPELYGMEARVGGGTSTHSGSINVKLVPRDQRSRSTREVVNDLREAIAEIPGITSRVSSRSNFAQRLASGSFGGSSGGDRISVAVQGQDLDLLRHVAGELQGIIGQVPGVSNVNVARDQGQPEFVIRVDRDRAADLGLTANQVASAVQTAVQGRVATQLRTGGREQSVRVVLQGMDAASTSDIENLPIHVGGGQYIPLSSVGRLIQQESPRSIQRIDQQRTVLLTASPEDRDLGSVVADIREAVNAHPLPDGVTIHFGGEYEEQQRAFREMLMVVLLAVALVYVVMASQFESLFDPFIVMFSVPFAAVGVILSLFLTGTPLTTQAFMGLIMLGGVVTNNAIILVSYINLLRERGVPLDEAVIEGSKTRLRPILMTTATTILALLPLAIGLGEGAELQAPLARTVIGGLIVSTMVTLILIPTLYRWRHHWWQNRRSAAKAQEGVKSPASAPAGAMGPAGATGVTISTTKTSPTTATAPASPAGPTAGPATRPTAGPATGPTTTLTSLIPLLIAGLATAAVFTAVAASEPVHAQSPSNTFADTSPGAASPPWISPELAIERAIANHPSIARARRNVATAESQLREAQAAYKPRVTVEADWNRREPLPGSSLSQGNHGASVTFRASETFATGSLLGRPNLALHQAETAVHTARLQLQNEIDAVTLSTLSAYVNVLKAENAVEASRRTLKRAEETLEQVSFRFDLGMASQYDLLQARAQLASSQAGVESAERRLEIAWARLHQAMGALPPDASAHGALADLEALPRLPGTEVTDGVGSVDIEAALDNVFERRLEVIRAKDQLTSAQMTAANRISDRTPVLTLSSSITGTDSSATLSWNSRDRNTALTVQAEVLDFGSSSSGTGGGSGGGGGGGGGATGGRPYWDVGFRVSWPLLDGGVDAEKTLQEAIRLTDLEEALSEQQRSVIIDVYDAYFAWLDATERLRSVDFDVEAARERVRQVEQRVEAGVETPNAAFDAQISLLQAERNAKEARWDALLAEARFRRAIGLPVWSFDLHTLVR